MTEQISSRRTECAIRNGGATLGIPMTDNTPPEFNSAAIKSRLALTWAQTLFGIGLTGALVAGAFLFLGFHLSAAVIVLALTLVIPLVSFFFGHTLVRQLTRCQEPDAMNPDHEMLLEVYDELWPVTGLPVRVPLYVSPIPIANAFATGRDHHHSMIAVTEGLFHAGLTRDEFKLVLAHELAHVKHYDSAIGTMVSAMGSIFAILLSTGLPWLFKSAFIQKGQSPLLNKLSDKVEDKKRFLLPATGIFGFLFMLILFYFVSIFTKLLTMFVSRARENAADALAAQWTGNPCALASALQKLVIFEQRNGGNYTIKLLTQGLTPLFIINQLGEDQGPAGANNSLSTRVSKWWKRSGQPHPPISERLEALDHLSGASCQRL